MHFLNLTYPRAIMTVTKMDTLYKNKLLVDYFSVSVAPTSIDHASLSGHSLVEDDKHATR